MIDFESVIEQYYTPGQPDYELLVAHSHQVADLACELAGRLTEPVDTDFVREAAMLHDVGIFATDAPGIHCHGTEPYLRHGIIGRQLLEELGLPRHAMVCERHIGAGLTAQEILEQQLPLPARDMLPLTVEEQLVTYADNFYSKSRIAPAKPIEQLRQQMSKYGTGTMQRFEAMVARFGLPGNDK